MVYYCLSPECASHSAKAKKLEKYAWMADITWVKFPRDPALVERWKKLLRLGRGDNCKANINKRSRLCSRHFDKDQLNVWGVASGFPKYFAWNNWGQSKSTAMMKIPVPKSYRYVSKEFVDRVSLNSAATPYIDKHSYSISSNIYSTFTVDTDVTPSTSTDEHSMIHSTTTAHQPETTDAIPSTSTDTQTSTLHLQKVTIGSKFNSI